MPCAFTHVVMSLEPPPPGPPPLESEIRTYFRSPSATSFASWLTVGAGSWPLKPPIVTTGSPVSMMICDVVCEPTAASRYVADPWWAWR